MWITTVLKTELFLVRFGEGVGRICTGMHDCMSVVGHVVHADEVAEFVHDHMAQRRPVRQPQVEYQDADIRTGIETVKVIDGTKGIAVLVHKIDAFLGCAYTV